MNHIIRLIPSIFKSYYNAVISFTQWRRRDFSGFSGFSPQYIKQKILVKYGIPNSMWVESGTYFGKTTRFLSERYPRVITIEPCKKLYSISKNSITNRNIIYLNGTSESIFPRLIPSLEGNCNFWLDGHYSEGITFKGEKNCPVEDELEEIAKNLFNFENVSIFIDDVRCFPSLNLGNEGYPSIDFLVDWSRENKLYWSVEHDIFIMRKIQYQAIPK